MVDLVRAVSDLVAAATSGTEPRALRRVVEKVLDAFEEAPEAAREAAIRKIGRALAGAEGQGAQVLCLALGALVEGGASPELAWPAVGRGLRELLEEATAFAVAAVERAKDTHLDAAIEAVGAEVARKNPRQAAAWNALPSRCLTAVACLTRSKELRARTRRTRILAEAEPLSDVVAEVSYLVQALLVVDDAELVVLAPAAGRAWSVAIDEVATNADIYVLLADALLGDPRKGLAGKRPDAAAVAAIRGGATKAKKRPASVRLPFHLVRVDAVARGGAPTDPANRVPPDGLPGEIPALGKQRIVILEPGAAKVALPSPVEGLSPKLRVVEELSRAKVNALLRDLGTPAPSCKARAKAK